MIKPGYTYRAIWTGEPVILYVTRRNHPTMEIEHLTGRLQGRTVTIEDRDRDWTEVCEGRHSNPEELLNPVELLDLPIGTVRIGTATGDRYEVRGVDGDQVWVLNGSAERCTWQREEFLRLTTPAPTFFQDGHDYERQIVAGGIVRVTVRRVGQMPNGTEYAVAERRNGSSAGEPVLLTAYDFPTYEDVTK